MKDTLETPEKRNGTGLGYPRHLSKDLAKPLTWSLSSQFISVGLQFKDKSAPKEVTDTSENPKEATLASPLYSEEVPDTTLQVSDVLPDSPKIPPPLDISANNSSKAFSEDTKAEDADPLSLCDLTNLFSNLWPCPFEQEEVGAID